MGDRFCQTFVGYVLWRSIWLVVFLLFWGCLGVFGKRLVVRLLECWGYFWKRLLRNWGRVVKRLPLPIASVGKVSSNTIDTFVYMSENAKSQLLEILKDLGCLESCAKFQSALVSDGCFRSTVVVKFPDGREVVGSGEGGQKSDASIAAAQVALDQLKQNYPDLIINWESIRIEAQAGDALIKLGVYLSADLTRASDTSKRLQELEPDNQLAKVFDRWKTQNDPDLSIWGGTLGKKRKATLVEALLWRRFKTDEMLIPLQSLLNTLL
jgi:hypothetical protein